MIKSVVQVKLIISSPNPLIWPWLCAPEVFSFNNSRQVFKRLDTSETLSERRFAISLISSEEKAEATKKELKF